MPLITIGLNHKTAPIELREKLAFAPQTLPEALESLIKAEGIHEAAILSTCNRTELYCATDREDDRHIIEWFSQFHGQTPELIDKYIYTLDHKSTIKHTMEVACGLDSMVLGEPQITGQMKDCYALANKHGTVGQLLGKLFQHAFAVAKQVRTNTDIGSNPVSVAFAAVSLAKQIFGNLDESTALLIGAGDTINLAARHLQSQNIKQIIIANRSIERAQLLAEEYDAEAIGLQHISDHLHLADIVISSTASPLPVLGKGTIERALKTRKHEPIFIVDLAVPRDIEPEVSKLDDIYLYSIDDLRNVVEENLQSRHEAAEQAHEIIDDESEKYLDWQRSLTSVDFISELRDSTHRMSSEVLEKARKQLSSGQPPEKVLEYLSHTLTNKFLHQPSTRIRQASEENRHELIHTARQLFINEDEENET